jgi:hypothetical protein
MDMKCLLVEPDYETKYPNLALMKISTKLKNEGSKVDYFKGKSPNTLDNYAGYDKIYITTLFTYYSKITIDTINYYRKMYGKERIEVGGIFASLMPDYIYEQTGITPFIGYDKELDFLKPDYDLIKTNTKWDDYSFVFTSRGCINHCPFCAVSRIEPEIWINSNWRNCIDLNRRHIMIHDNNLTSMPIAHFKDVCDFIREKELRVVFDNGFDALLFSDEHLDLLQDIKIERGGLRFAFDSMKSDGYIQNTIRKCIDNGIPKDKITVYLLFNFNEKPLEAEYRMREIVNLKVRPYPQKYTPLNVLDKSPPFVGKYWTPELATEFRYFYLMCSYHTKYTFPEWLEKEGKKELLLAFHGENA